MAQFRKENGPWGEEARGRGGFSSPPARPSQPAQPRARHSLLGARASQPARLPAPPSLSLRQNPQASAKLRGKPAWKTRKSTWGRCALRWPTQAKGAALWLSTWGRRQVDAPILGLDPGLDNLDLGRPRLDLGRRGVDPGRADFFITKKEGSEAMYNSGSLMIKWAQSGKENGPLGGRARAEGAAFPLPPRAPPSPRSLARATAC